MTRTLISPAHGTLPALPSAEDRAAVRATAARVAENGAPASIVDAVTYAVHGITPAALDALETVDPIVEAALR